MTESEIEEMFEQVEVIQFKVDELMEKLNRKREAKEQLKKPYGQVLDEIINAPMPPPTKKGKNPRWMLWPSVSEVLNSPTDTPYPRLSSLLNRVWFSMSGQGYAKEDGEAFYNEVQRLNKFSPESLERAHGYIKKYWPNED